MDPAGTDVAAAWVQRIVVEDAVLTEQRIRALIQPKPRWLPGWAWRRILHRLLVLEYGPREVRR